MLSKLKEIFSRCGSSMVLICFVLGFILAAQFKNVQGSKSDLQNQRIEELAARLVRTEEERDELSKQISKISSNRGLTDDLKLQSCTVPLIGEGISVKMDDSTRVAKSGENPNLYLIHDDDILRVINELRAAGAEAISINGQRLIATSEIRCAGPTLSVNNVRSAPPYEINAIGDKKSLEGAIKMRGGVAETLKVWGITLEVTPSDEIKIPAYNGAVKNVYAKILPENQ